MTEDEAKTKWCPFGRTTIAIQGAGEGFQYPPAAPSAHNRVAFADAPATKQPMAIGACIASACMAWREARKIGHGFCGLAGEPL